MTPELPPQAARIETALRRHPAIEAATVLVGRQGARQQAVALVILAAGAALQRAEMEEYLSTAVPDTDRTPLSLVTLNTVLPTRRDAATWPAAHPSPDGDPRYDSDLERLLSLIWGAVLKRAPLGPHDNVLSLGAHSLDVIRVISRIESLLPLEIPLHVIFDGPTVRELAKALTTRAAAIGDLDRIASIVVGMWSELHGRNAAGQASAAGGPHAAAPTR